MALQDFIKKNVSENVQGNLTKGFLLFDVANLATSENKLKSVLGILRDLVLSRAVQGGFFAGLFLAMSRSIKALVKDTGSLEAALKKLSQIQTLKNVFTPLVGGAEAAKRKVAELVNFAATKKISLGDASEAERTLLTLTRGGFAGPRALEKITDAATATNSSITGVANAVGDLSEALRSGSGIESSVEQLRQLGIVTEAEADKLIALEQSGVSADAVFNTFTDTLSKFQGSAEATADDIDRVNASYEAAIANLQQQFASPFVESDIQNTKNMTDALNGIAPTVGKISGILGILTNGFSTVKTSMAKTAGESKIVQEAVGTLATALLGIVSIGAVIGTSVLATFMFTLGKGLAVAGAEATVAATGFGAAAAGIGTFAAGIAGIAISVVSVAGALLIAAGVGKQIGDAFDRSAKAIQDLAVANNQANEAIRKQVQSAQTLTELHTALAAATDRLTESQLALNKAREDGDPAKVAEAEANLAIAQKNVRNAQKKETGPGPLETQSARQKIEREFQEKEQRFQNKLATAPPEVKSQLLGQRAATLTARAATGETGERARVNLERESALAAKDIENAQSRLRAAEAKKKGAETQDEVAKRSGNALFGASAGEVEEAARTKAQAEREIAKARRDLAAAQARAKSAGESAPAGTSVALERQANLLKEGNDPKKFEKLQALSLQIERAKKIEEERTQNALDAQQASADRAELDRQISLDKARLKTEEQIAGIKEDGFARSDKEMSLRLHLLDIEEAAEKARGANIDSQNLSRIAAQRDELEHTQRIAREQNAMTRAAVDAELKIQAAQISNDSKEQRRLEDLGVFTEKFNQLIGQGFEKSEAADLAKKFAGNAVNLNTQQTGLALNSAAVADSLTRIGGGGGLYAPGGGTDPMLSLAQRQLQVQESAENYLKEIAQKAGAGVL